MTFSFIWVYKAARDGAREGGSEGGSQRFHSGGLFYANEDRERGKWGRARVRCLCRALSVKWGDFVVDVHHGDGRGDGGAGRKEGRKEGRKFLRVSEQ